MPFLTIDDWHILFVSLMWLGAVPLVIWSYFQVSRWRKPLYALALPVAVLMATMYGNTLLNHVWDVPIVINIRIGVRIAFFVLALLFYLVTFVDRLEHRTDVSTALINKDLNDLTTQLSLDQQLTMDKQHLVMGEQRDVMGEQRQAMHDSEEGIEQDGD